MNEVEVFKYETLDVAISNFLREKESNIRDILSNAYQAVAKELYEAQQALAGKNQYDGLFHRWLAHIKYPPSSAYELIGVHKERLRITETQIKVFDTLPIGLAKTISTKSSESTPAKTQAKSEVLDGKIDTLKSYRDRITELESQAKQATEKAEQAESARQIAEEIFFRKVVQK